MQEDASTGVGRGEARAGPEHLVIHREGFVVATCVDEQRGEPQPQAEVFRVVLQPCAIGRLCPRPVASGIARQREGLPCLGVTGVEGDAPGQRRGRVLRLAPAQQARPQDPVGIGVLGRGVARAEVCPERQIVAPFELVREADLDDGPWVPRAQGREPLEGEARLGGGVGHQLGAREFEPSRGVRGVRLGRRREVSHSAVEVAVGHGSPPYPHVPRRARWDCHGDEEDPAERLTCPRRAQTIAAMDRSTLTRILEEAGGIRGSGAAFEPSEGHELSFYLGPPGRAMVLGGVRAVHLHQGYVQLDRKPTEGSLYLDYEAIHGVAIRPPDDVSGRRPGF